MWIGAKVKFPTRISVPRPRKKIAVILLGVMRWIRFERLKDNIKSRSVFYDLLRKIKHKYYNRKEKLIYDFDHALNNPKKKKTSFMDFDDALQKYDVKKLLIENSKLIEK